MGSLKAIVNHLARDSQYFMIQIIFQNSFGWGPSTHGN